MKGNNYLIIFLILFLFPLLDAVLPQTFRFADSLQVVFIFALLALGLNFVTGYTGMLHLGAAGVMAIGAYTFAIFTCDIYPFQVGFWGGCLLAMIFGTFAGFFLWFPVIRLTGDYLAIVTLGFGEIVQALIRNLDLITKGTQGINPLPEPNIFSYHFDHSYYQPWYYLFLTILFIFVLFNHFVCKSKLGRKWFALREDELASKCMGNNTANNKLSALCLGSAVSALAGALWASYLGSSGEPSNYDFQISVIALCIIILGGINNIAGVVIGALVIVGFNSIILVKLSSFLAKKNLIDSSSVLLSPGNWKYFIFGMLLILMVRYKPEGFIKKR